MGAVIAVGLEMPTLPLLLLLLLPAAALECFFCRHTLRRHEVAEHIDQHPECMSHEMFGAREDMRRQCAEREPFCVVSDECGSV